MKNTTLVSLFIFILSSTLMGCTAKTDTSTDTPAYDTITATKAKEMMDQDGNIIILDVRTTEEFNIGHIEGALLIPDYEIKEKAEDTLTDKSATILIYCRSGRRSALSAQLLIELGYDNVYDFGGIIDWEYDIVN